MKKPTRGSCKEEYFEAMEKYIEYLEYKIAELTVANKIQSNKLTQAV